MERLNCTNRQERVIAPLDRSVRPTECLNDEIGLVSPLERRATVSHHYRAPATECDCTRHIGPALNVLLQLPEQWGLSVCVGWRR